MMSGAVRGPSTASPGWPGHSARDDSKLRWEAAYGDGGLRWGPVWHDPGLYWKAAWNDGGQMLA
jgi:hypothetical protein